MLQIQSNAELQQKVDSANDFDSLRDIAAEHGFELSNETLSDYFLSDQDLEGVAGGSSINNTCETIWFGCKRDTKNDPGCKR